MEVLQKEAELQEIVQLVGPDALPEGEKLTLETARVLREDFLQQSAFSEVDAFCPIEKQVAMLQVVVDFYVAGTEAIKRGVTLAQLLELPHKGEIAGLKDQPPTDETPMFAELSKQIKADFAHLEVV